MGVTKQAAQKRFVAKADTEPLDPNRGFARFTPRPRAAVVHAQNTAVPFSGPAEKVLELTFGEALRLGHNYIGTEYIGTEHLLLALLESDDTDGPLGRLGIDRQRAQTDLIGLLDSITGAGTD